MSVHAGPRGEDAPVPIVIAHRGASGYAPEHTLASFEIAIQQGADYIEPDVVMSKDGVLIVRHENEISGTTNIADLQQFAERKTTKVIDGVRVTGWFTEDFTFAELKTLRARERLPQLRVANARLNDQFEIASFDEVLDLVQATNQQRARSARRSGKRPPPPIGLYPETKHPTHFDHLGLSLEEPLVRALHHAGYKGNQARAFIQSFEVSNLKDLRGLTKIPLIQLIDSDGQPYDFVSSKDTRTYDDLASIEGLRFVASYADGIGVDKYRIFKRSAEDSLGEPTSLVADARAAGLLVHAWTLRAENYFLAANFRRGTGPHELGDMASEATAFLQTGINGFFTDHPNIGVAARDEFVRNQY